MTLKWEIIRTGGLPHLSGLPDLNGVPHLHVNRPIDLPWKSQWRTRHRHLEAKLTRFDDFTKRENKDSTIANYSSVWITTLSIPTLLPNLASPTPLLFLNGENNRLCLTYCAIDSAKQNTALKWCGRFTGMFHDERAYKTKQEGTCYI